ncbi:MAG: hypothetical protein Q4B65_00320, partial [Candidatus Saccharibacteria bacterium]|nr:hypothetical protein [Candidatus Saccharibacteria bacterium]
ENWQLEREREREISSESRQFPQALTSQESPGTDSSAPVFSGGFEQPQVQGVPFSGSPVSSGTGDIILARDTGRSKKGIIVGFLISGLVLVVGVLVALYFLFLDNKTGEITALLSEKKGGVQVMENVFVGSYYTELSVGDFFTEEKRDKINEAMADFSALQKGLSGIDPSRVDSDKQENFRIVRERLNTRVENYQKSVDFYNKLYAAYTSGDVSGIEDLLDSEDYYTALIAERFYNYITEQNKWWGIIEERNCSVAIVNNATEACKEATSNYAENINSLLNSSVVMSAIFNTGDISYSEEELIVPYINKILGEEK